MSPMVAGDFRVRLIGLPHFRANFTPRPHGLGVAGGLIVSHESPGDHAHDREPCLGWLNAVALAFRAIANRKLRTWVRARNRVAARLASVA